MSDTRVAPTRVAVTLCVDRDLERTNTSAAHGSAQTQIHVGLGRDYDTTLHLTGSSAGMRAFASLVVAAADEIDEMNAYERIDAMRADIDRATQVKAGAR